MAKTAIGVIMVVLLLTGCGGQNHDLLPIGKQLDALANAHDMDGFARYLADDAVAKAPDGSMHNGKDSARAWFAGLMPGFHVQSWGYQQSGDTLAWMSAVQSDVFASMGVNPVKVNTMAVFSGDKVRYFQAVLSQETQEKLLFLQFYAEVVNGGNVDAIDKFVTEDMIEHQVVPPGSPKGREGVKSYFRMVREAYPDVHATPTLLLAEGNLVFVAATWEGTNKGRFMGKQATNKKTSWPVADVIRIVDGKATEHWGW